jgi:hypothetical protein
MGLISPAKELALDMSSKARSSRWRLLSSGNIGSIAAGSVISDSSAGFIAAFYAAFMY